MDMNPIKNWECSTCSKTFKTKTYLKRHVVTHDTNAKVKCEICQKISKNAVALSQHMRRLHTIRKRSGCNICQTRVFLDSLTLRGHTDTSERPCFPCGFLGCDKTFLKKQNVSRHIRTVHAEKPVLFRCTLCGKGFKRRAHLESHIPTHTTEKPYNCATCGRSFARRKTMLRHEKIHPDKSSREMFTCQVCARIYTRRDSLRQHSRVSHENLRYFACPFCDQGFTTLCSMRCHVDIEHPGSKEKIHSCEKCKYKGNSKVSLANHARRHNNAT